jgi:hypothetical protein
VALIAALEKAPPAAAAVSGPDRQPLIALVVEQLRDNVVVAVEDGKSAWHGAADYARYEFRVGRLAAGGPQGSPDPARETGAGRRE